ncbi:MAG: hypothetical protein K6G75_03705 [Lachnospiraceae bacterium]|nr:hypothetical protein [Lachnospiraceae bacterium]
MILVRFVLAALTVASVCMIPLTGNAEGEPVKIYSAKDMELIAKNPDGDFVLMDDIDMKDVSWKPVDFTGTLDGNDHAILNLNVTETSEATRVTYDGNYKTYDTYFAGLFGVLEDAEVKNLILKGINVNVEKDEPCFVGSVAGFCEKSRIVNCSIEGIIRLDANSKMFGVGGIVGYGGDASITETDADVTLICIDHDKENRDEQFMGGGYSAGYIDVDKCSIKIDGYDSDHGYVHDGGLVGMYILYPLGNNYAGYINNTRVEGMITFFEDNTDRRAYCKDFIGEVMNWTYEYVGNSSDFTRNEIKDYSKDLLPHYCEGNDYTKETVEGSCEEYGYTLYKCNECGYSYKADYTMKIHTVDSWETVIEPTFEEEGMEEGTCKLCGAKTYRSVPVKEEEVIEEPEPVIENIEITEPEEQKPAVKEKNGGSDSLLGIFVAVGLVVCVALTVAIVVVLIRGRRRR